MLTPRQIESREDVRNLSRLLIVCGSFILCFGVIALVYVGQDLRDGRAFMASLLAGSAIIGLALIGAGLGKRRTVGYIVSTDERITRRGDVIEDDRVHEADREVLDERKHERDAQHRRDDRAA